MTDPQRLKFNPPPGWPKPPEGWSPPKGWTPDPSWPAPPPGWSLWIPADNSSVSGPTEASDIPSRTQADASTQKIPDRDARVALLEAENAALRLRLQAIGTNPAETVQLDDERTLQEVGIYRYHHPLENALAYRTRLDELEARIAEMIKSDRAIERSNLFTFNGSLAEGRRMANDLSKLMLRAYNAEVDNVIRTLRVGNVVTAKKRLDSSRATIAKLGRMMEMGLSEAFHKLRLEEVELTADYLMKKQEEREAEREERERLREEKKVELELAAERERLAKERSHLVTAIQKIEKAGGTDSALTLRLAEVDKAIEQNDYRAANVRAGYVYVISNRGAFGEHIVKIGLTRRLDPQERINELGDASVPFRFDVHAIYFSEDAVTLENELHERFAKLRVNWANMRREFFFAAPAKVREVLAEKIGNLLEFREKGESTEYLQSVQYWPNEIGRPGPARE